MYLYTTSTYVHTMPLHKFYSLYCVSTPLVPSHCPLRHLSPPSAMCISTMYPYSTCPPPCVSAPDVPTNTCLYTTCPSTMQPYTYILSLNHAPIHNWASTPLSSAAGGCDFTCNQPHSWWLSTSQLCSTGSNTRGRRSEPKINHILLRGHNEQSCCYIYLYFYQY